MKEGSWDEWIGNDSARQVSPDIGRASSLIETSRERLAVIKGIDDKNCNFVFEDHYTSLLELLQALVLQKGFNVRNHVCLGYYIRDVLGREDLFARFDDVRYKRNALTYYGSRMEYETAVDAIKTCRSLIQDIRVMVNRIR